MSSVEPFIPFVSAGLLAILTYDLYRRYQQHKGAHRHLLFWGIGLAMFGVASLCDGLLRLGWNEFAFIGWYMFGAVLNAAWIGQGTVFLLFRRRWVEITAVILAIVSVLVVVMLLSTPLDPSGYHAGVPIAEQYQTILPKGAVVRYATPIFNIYGTLTLVGGALYSGYLFYRKRVLPNRVVGNVLIAAAALAVAGAGTLNRLGYGEWHSTAQLIFSVLMYAGFVLASKPAAVQQTQTPPTAPKMQASRP